MVLKMHFSKIFLSETLGPEISYLAYNTIFKSSSKIVQSMPLGSYLTPSPRGHSFTLNYKENYFLKLLPLNHLWKFDQTQQE